MSLRWKFFLSYLAVIALAMHTNGLASALQVEVDDTVFSDEVKQLQKLAQAIESRIKDYLTVSVKVRLVEPRTIPRSEGKAQRVIDRRQL